MDIPKLPEKLYGAGREYLGQLRGLGLRPEGLLWVYDFRHEKFVLWLVWSGLDKIGPFAISKILFKAYRNSALTHEIDPFFVDLRSPKDIFTMSIMTGYANKEEAWQFGNRTDVDDVQPTHHIERDWIYHFQSKRRSSLDVNRDWRRFSDGVQSMAA